ncbi:B9 domain-containing protein 2 [Blyttiomyces sp. JEL0837]|nr:B9 domain-containing protein 2 [Blyttiomyces sp. JEL0837]
MAEVHVIGTILGASGFPKSELCTKWTFVAGDEWNLVEGDEAGQTQVDLPEDPRYTVWSHPIVPGTHVLECVTWKPAGTLMDQVWAFFLGATPQLRNLELVHNPSDRFRLQTIAMGKVHLEVSVLVRNFENYGVSL